MAKKYLSLEEAAAELNISPEELKRKREAGDIRGFSDRGTWKFKPEDVENLGRTLHADSSPSVPILDSGVGVGGGGEGSSVVLGEGSSVVMGDSSVIFADDEDDVGQQQTIVRKGEKSLADAASDSDVRLVLDDSLTTDSNPDVNIPAGSDSDSDVRLVDDSPNSDDSDSDVKLVEPASTISLNLSDESDSDVKLVGDASQSDIVLDSTSGIGGSDSDVKLIGSDVVTDRDIELAPVSDDSVFDEDEIRIADPDSGISLAPADSGISLEPMDSGIALESAADSGISLMADDEDSGISLASPTDSGIALEALGDAGDADETQFEMAALDDSEFELKTKSPSGTGSDTGVIVFDDEADFDDHGATMVRGAPASAVDEFGSSESFEFDDDLEVADDVIGEDDELDDMDVFDAGDEDFADSFEAGESHAEFRYPGAVAAPVQQEWGAGTFIGLLLTTALMAVCAMVMFDFARSIWDYNKPSGFTSTMMGIFSNFFKK